ncbi:reverse transcriptase domain-containing protein [Tanacetum coccineum]
MERSIDHTDLEICNSIVNEFIDDFVVDRAIGRINVVDTTYSERQETEGTNMIKSEHLYLAIANEIDEKKPELKNLPSHLEYAYLHGNKSFPMDFFDLWKLGSPLDAVVEGLMSNKYNEGSIYNIRTCYGAPYV